MSDDPKRLALAVKFEMYRRDFSLFGMEQLKIKGAEPGKILPLDIRVKPLQQRLWSECKIQLAGQGFVRGVILKARQQGGSVGTQGIFYWKSSTTPNFDTLLMAHDPPTTAKIFTIARHYYDHVHPTFRPMIRNCVDDETECLKRTGWTKRRDLNRGDEIYTLNPQTGLGQWERVIAIHQQEVEAEPMVRWDSNDCDAFVTLDHKWLVTTWRRKDRPFGISPSGRGSSYARTFHKRFSVVRTSDLGMMNVIPTGAPSSEIGVSISDALLALLGWTAAEGCYVKRKGAKRPNEVRIYQSQWANPGKVEQIRDAAKQSGLKFCERTDSKNGITTFKFSRKAGARIKELLPDKRFDLDVVSRLSARQAAIVLDALVDGDGSRDPVYRGYWSADRVLAEQVQMIAAMAGTPSRIGKAGKQPKTRKRAIERYGDGMCVGLHGRPVAYVANLQKKQEILEYTGTIWCPETNTGTWLARRNTCTYFTHNSSKIEMVFENPDPRTRFDNPGLRSRMDFMDASKKFAGTGLTRHGNHLSEAAKFPPETTHILASSMIPQLHDLPGTFLINESTAWVEGDWFRACCEEARSGLTRYFWIFSPWFMDPEYQLALEKGERIVPDAEERALIKLAAKGNKADKVPSIEVTHQMLKWRREKIHEFEIAGITANGAEFFEQEYPKDYDCIPVGSRVGTQWGLIPIEDVTIGDTTAFGEVLTAMPKGPRNIYRVTTKRGYSFRATAGHPVPTPCGDIRLRDLMGYQIKLGAPAFARERYRLRWQESFGLNCDIDITPDFARFLGYFMGDGSLHVGGGNKGSQPVVISICCDARDVDVIANVRQLLVDLTGHEVQGRIVGSKRGGYELRTGAVGFLPLAKRLGIYSVTAPHRKVCVPECIWRSPKPIVRDFLQGLFEADAGYRGARAILLFSKHRQFLEDIQVLLLGFGIEGSLSSAVKTASRDGVAHEYLGNELCLHAEATNRFVDEIGFISERKRSKFFLRIDNRGRNARPMLGLDEVIKIEADGVNDTCDLEIADSHVFDSNGIVVHNSAWISLDLFVFPRQRCLELQRKCPPPKLVRLIPGNPVRSVPSDDRFDLESNYRAVWQFPEPGKQYDLGIDISAGIEGGDWTVIQVLERFTLRQCAEIHLQVDAFDLASEIYWWGAFYNWGQVCIEFNAEGIAVNQVVQRMDYPYLYFWRLRSGAYPKVTKITGWKTQRDSKKLLVLTARSKFTKGEVEVNSRWLFAEMLNFVQIPSGDEFTYRAQMGHDDRPMAWMIAIICSEDESLGVLPESERQERAQKPKLGIEAELERQVGLREPESSADKEEYQRLVARALGGGSDWPENDKW